MPYYRGDYVGQGTTNYYRGDPFLGALLGGLARGVGLGKVAAKVGKWAVQRISGSGLKKAATAVATTVGGTVLYDKVTGGRGQMDVGPIQIDPGAMLPGGRPFISIGGKRYRRMNPLNPKALKRALRRAEGFEKFAKSTMSTLYKTSDGTRSRKFKRQTKPRS